MEKKFKFKDEKSAKYVEKTTPAIEGEKIKILESAPVYDEELHEMMAIEGQRKAWSVIIILSVIMLLFGFMW